MENNQTGYVPNLSQRIQTLSETAAGIPDALPGFGNFNSSLVYTAHAGGDNVGGFSGRKDGNRWFGLEIDPWQIGDNNMTCDFDGLRFPGETGNFYTNWELLDGYFDESSSLVITGYNSGKICLIRLDKNLAEKSGYYDISLNFVYKHTGAHVMASIYDPIEI